MINNLKVYVINLKQDTERLKNISYELNKQNINDFEIIEAIDAKRINKKELNFSISKNKKFINPLNTNMNDQEICCSLSHLKAYEKFINSKFFIIIIGTIVSVFIYYINYFSSLFGSNETIPIMMSIWLPHLILFLFCLLGGVKLNEN